MDVEIENENEALSKELKPIAPATSEEDKEEDSDEDENEANATETSEGRSTLEINDTVNAFQIINRKLPTLEPHSSKKDKKEEENEG